MLLINFSIGPPKSLAEFIGPLCIEICLHIIEYSLEAKWDTLIVINISRYLKYCSSERSNNEVNLEETIQVASCSLID